VLSEADTPTMSDDDVISALSTAAATDTAAERGEQAPTTSVTDAPEGATQPESTSQVQPQETANTSELFDNGQFNPDTLPPELQPAWKQLQAAFTKRTQEVAAERSQIEALGSVEEIQQAVELVSRISDPQNWVQLHGELTEAMREAGLTPAEAQAAATEVMQQTSPDTPGLDGFADDPELAPLAQMLKETRAELDAFKQERDQERMNAEAERQHIQYLTELQKQEAVIRESHPQWGDDKIEAVYEMSSFYGGNLAQAASRLDALLNAERELYLNQKSGAMTDSTRTPSTTTLGTETQRVTAPESLREMEDEATEFFKARLADLGE
jgi:hypothetical protein